MKSILLMVALVSVLTGCATTSGIQQIQKKCKSVENMTDTFVCEQP